MYRENLLKVFNCILLTCSVLSFQVFLYKSFIYVNVLLFQVIMVYLYKFERNKGFINACFGYCL